MQRGVALLIVCLVALAPGGAVAATQAVSPAPASAETVDRPTATSASGSPVPSVNVSTSARGSIEIVNVSTVPASPYPGQSVRFKLTLRNDGEAPVSVDWIRVVPRKQEGFISETRYAQIGNLGRLQPGETRTIRFEQEFGPNKEDKKFTEPGLNRLWVNVTGETRDPQALDNESLEASRRLVLDVKEEPTRPTVSITGENLVADGKRGEVTVEVTNDAEITLKDAQLRLRTQQVSVTDRRRVIGNLDPGQTKKFVFNVSTTEAGQKLVGAEVRYGLYDDKKGTAAKQERLSFRAESTPTPTETDTDRNETPGDLTISRHSFEVDEENRTVHISGTVGNVGGLPANGVTLEVVGTDGVTPTQPNPKFFVDEGLSADDSSSFDLYATVEENVSTIQIKISYRTNGTNKTEFVDLGAPEVSSASTSEAENEEGGGGAGMLIGGLVVAGVLGMIGYAWRNANDDDGEAPVTPDSPSGEAPISPGDPDNAAGELMPSDQNGGQGSQPPNQQATQPQPPNQGTRPQGPGRQAGQRNQQPAQNGGRSPQAGQQRSNQQFDPQGQDPQPAPGGTRQENTVDCDSCGTAYPPGELDKIALNEGTTARTCQDCRVDALKAAKAQLTTKEESDSSGVGDLVSEMSEQPTCDSCGNAVPESDIEEMTLPDGTVTVSCSACLKEALDAAREEIVSDGDRRQ